MDEGGKIKQLPIKRRDVGIAGALIVLAQLFSDFKASHNVSSEILKFREEFQSSKLEREQFFVRKSELDSLGHKLEKINDQLFQLSQQVVSLRTFLKSKYNYTSKFYKPTDDFLAFKSDMRDF